MANYKKYRWEITECFKEQYPERWEKYEIFFKQDLFLRSQNLIQKAILTYCDLIEDLDVIVTIIRELEGVRKR